MLRAASGRQSCWQAEKEGPVCLTLRTWSQEAVLAGLWQCVLACPEGAPSTHSRVVCPPAARRPSVPLTCPGVPCADQAFCSAVRLLLCLSAQAGSDVGALGPSLAALSHLRQNVFLFLLIMTALSPPSVSQAGFLEVILLLSLPLFSTSFSVILTPQMAEHCFSFTHTIPSNAFNKSCQ